LYARPGSREPLISAHGVSYRYSGALKETIKPLDLEINAGERLLLLGPSGGGKSTLAALLMGLRTPSAGSLRSNGANQRLVGLGRWRNAISGAPQFHENHLFCGTLAFNLLMGRWPASDEDMALARQVCQELGLGPLLQRMPAGLNQPVGDGGWRLSHGERSRVFLARAILQNPELVVVDESFGALDPQSLLQTMQATLHHSRTLLVIDHSATS
jgi:ATP-binding cassette subfamily B protein